MTHAIRSVVRHKRELLLPHGSLRARFASGVFWSLSAALVSRGFNLAAFVACARLMGQSRFGEYGMVQSTVNALGTFSVLGLGLTATRYVAEYRDKDPGRVARIVRLSALVSAASGGLIAVLLALLSPLLASRVLAAPHLAVPLRLGSVMVFLGALIAFQNGALAGFEAFRPLARVGVVSGVLSFPLIALGAWKGGLEGAVIGTAASLLVNVVLNGALLRARCDRARQRGGAEGWRQEVGVFWRFSLPAFLASFAVAPALWACNALLANRPDGYPQLGIYAAADRWRVALLFVPTTVFRMALPMLSNLKGRSDAAGFRRVNQANVLLNLVLVAVPALVLSGFAAPIMASYGPGFRSGWSILAILALGTIPEALNTVFGYPLVVGHRMWTRFGFDVLLSLVLVGLGAVLIPRWAATGLAVAYVAAFTVTSAGLYLFTWRLSEVALRIPTRAPPTARPG
jgi:O-antigen/teichoic acid export membrane protein